MVNSEEKYKFHLGVKGLNTARRLVGWVVQSWVNLAQG